MAESSWLSLVAQMIKNPPVMKRHGSIPESGNSPGEENGYPLKHPCLENSTDRGAWRATVHGVLKSQIPLNHFTFTSEAQRDASRPLERAVQDGSGGRDTAKLQFQLPPQPEGSPFICLMDLFPLEDATHGEDYLSLKVIENQ